MRSRAANMQPLTINFETKLNGNNHKLYCNTDIQMENTRNTLTTYALCEYNIVIVTVLIIITTTAYRSC